MELAMVLYYSTSYAITLSGLVYTFVARDRTVTGRWYAATMGILAAASVCMSVNSLLPPSRGTDLGLTEVLNAIQVGCMSATAFTVPRFAASLRNHKFQAVSIRTGSALAAAGVSMTANFALPFGLRDAAVVFAAVVVMATFVYGFLVLAFAEPRKEPVDPKWRTILRDFAWTGAAVLPISLASDVFGLFEPLREVKFLPLLVAAWNVAYVTRSRRAANRELDWGRFPLTERERQIAGLLLDGYSYRGIAESLGVSVGTVKTHVLHVYEKTGAGNKIELLRFLERR